MIDDRACYQNRELYLSKQSGWIFYGPESCCSTDGQPFVEQQNLVMANPEYDPYWKGSGAIRNGCRKESRSSVISSAAPLCNS